MFGDRNSQVRFGPYRLVRRIGSGGMGEIFEARDTCLGHRVALKLLHRDIAKRAGASDLLLREGLAAARVQHPHVIRVLSWGTERGTPYLAMELLHGFDLSKLISRRRPLAVDEALDLVLPAFAGVAAAHDVGVIHCDLKPANVYVARGPGEPRPKVLDFGLSRVLTSAENFWMDAVTGTPAYMSPEQARAASRASFASDQYSLAALLYQCITGTLPFGCRSFENLESRITVPPPPPSDRAAGISRALDELVLRAMSPAPSDRFSCVRQFGAALLPFASRPRRCASRDAP
jgi:serine/threonine protein kinase